MASFIQSTNCATSVYTTVEFPSQSAEGETETIPLMTQNPFSLKHKPLPESPKNQEHFQIDPKTTLMAYLCMALVQYLECYRMIGGS